MFNKLFKWCNGRHTSFAVFFTIMGTLLAWFHRLDPSYVALVGAIQALVCAHSVQENYFEKKQDANQ